MIGQIALDRAAGPIRTAAGASSAPCSCRYCRWRALSVETVSESLNLRGRRLAKRIPPGCLASMARLAALRRLCASSALLGQAAGLGGLAGDLAIACLLPLLYIVCMCS
jgi:hypothetical protein